jgi:hypothetical protein
MIDINDMAKICMKCPNYHHADNRQDEDGCMLKRPLANCPQLLKVYHLPDEWNASMWHQGMNGGRLCANELERTFLGK